MKALYYKLLHKIIAFIGKTFGSIHAPWIRKNILYQDVMEMKGILEIGDIFLTRTNGELTTALIPGYYKHAAIYVGQDKIIDATGAGVQKRWLADLAMHTDNICILRVNDYTPALGKKIVEYAYLQIGKKYDFEMNINDVSTFYCSELIFDSINGAVPNYLDLRESLGIDTLTPEDIYLAEKKFKKIYEKTC
jgi:uncharacterized protein YycO